MDHLYYYYSEFFFQVDSLSPPLLFGLVGIYHVPLPVEYFSAFSFCLDCCVWGACSIGWQFVVPLYLDPRGETGLASNQIPKWSPQPETPREIHSYVEKSFGGRI